jgi:hypothetical protein
MQLGVDRCGLILYTVSITIRKKGKNKLKFK